MIRTVQCTACSTSFPVDPRKVPEEGVYARCSSCQGVFFVEGGMAMAAAATPATHEAVQEETGYSGEETSFSGATTPDFSAPMPELATSTSGALAEPDIWVFETEPEIYPASLEVGRLDTVEEHQRIAKDDTPSFSNPAGISAPAAPSPITSDPIWDAPPPPPAPEPIKVASPPPPPPAPIMAAPPPAPAPPAAKPAAPAGGFSFGKRDPHEKAARLARVLVSDIITYNPERHQRALDGRTLKQDFEDEIKKSWGEYVDQVGRDLAESTEYFSQALNEILARGQKIF